MELPVNIDISSLDAYHLRAMEEVLGKSLTPNQRLVIQVEEVSTAPNQGATEAVSNSVLPTYCNVYAGLTDDEVAEIETSILDRSPSR